MLITVGFPSVLHAMDEDVPSQCVFFQQHNKIKSPLMSKLSTVLHKKKKMKAILLEGEKVSPIKLSGSAEVRKAIQNCTPMVISSPTRAHMQSISGIAIGPCSVAVVIPNKRGEEFTIYTIREEGKNLKRVRTLQGEDKDLDAQVHTIKTIIDDMHVERSIEKEVVPNKGNHKRWTVQDVKPYFWGKQGQFMDVGYQIDLYNVVDPGPRKYLTIQTVGKGVSAGKVMNDSRFHRGLFQTKVSVAIEDLDYIGWQGAPLRLERYAPESENHSNTVTVTTGATFTAAVMPGLTFTGLAYGNSYAGFSLNYSKGEACSFRDYTVNVDPVYPAFPSKMQWTYWLNGANGAKLRKEYQAYDLVKYLRICELPQLAKDSILMPHMECVYYADGEETGEVTFLGTVRQELLGIRNYIVSHSVEEKADYLNHLFTVDFSQVHS